MWELLSVQDDIDGAVKYLKARKDGLPDPRRSLADEIPSHAIEQANQEIRQLTTKESKGKCGPSKKYIFECVMRIDAFP